MDIVLFLILLVILGVVGVILALIPIPLLGPIYAIIIAVIGLVLGWDASLIWLIMTIMIMWTCVAIIVVLIGSVVTGGISLVALLPYLFHLAVYGIIGTVAFILMLVDLLGAGEGVSLDVLIGLIGSIISSLGLGAVYIRRKAGNSPKTCFTLNNQELCFGSDY